MEARSSSLCQGAAVFVLCLTAESRRSWCVGFDCLYIGRLTLSVFCFLVSFFLKEALIFFEQEANSLKCLVKATNLGIFSP